MPLHPQCRTFLDQFAAANIPPLDQLPLDQIRSFAVPIPGELDPVRSVDDRTIDGPNGDVPIRIYQPEGEPAARPAIVFFHGGGWVMGYLDLYDSLCQSFAKAGDCVVVSVDYRLSPEHKFPAGVEDSFAATSWLAEHADELGVDRNRLVVCGDSAGGNLAAAVCLMARDRKFGSIAAQVLVYPITNDDFDTPSYLEFADGYMLTRRSMQWFFQQYLQQPEQALPQPFLRQPLQCL